MTELANGIGFSLSDLAKLCEEAEGKDKSIITSPDRILGMIDKIEGLEHELESAVKVAFARGATDWVRLNYPDIYKRLSTP